LNNLILKINKLPIKAGITKFISQIPNDTAKIPDVLVLNNCTNWILADHINPRSVKNVKLGTTAIIKNIMLTPANVCPNVSATPKSENSK
jgi:hypothetical protein